MFTVIYYLSAVLSFVGMWYYIITKSKSDYNPTSLFENVWPTPREIFILLSVTLLFLVISCIPVANTFVTILTFCHFIGNNAAVNTWWNSPIKK